jgi:hypothetical protein
MDGATVDAWLHFPGAKVGQNNFYFLPFLTFLVAGVDCQS